MTDPRSFFGLPPLDPSVTPEAEAHAADTRARAVLGIGPRDAPPDVAPSAVSADEAPRSAVEAVREAMGTYEAARAAQGHTAAPTAPEPPVGFHMDTSARGDGEDTRAALARDADAQRRSRTAPGSGGWQRITNSGQMFHGI